MLFICQYCGKQIGTELDETNHGSLVSHEKFCKLNPNRCKQSNMSFESRIKASERIKKYNKERVKHNWKCHYCKAVFRTQEACYRHQHKVHQKEMDKNKKKKYIWKCKYCGNFFRTRRLLQNHNCEIKNSLPHDKLGRIIPNKKGDFYCQFCKRYFKTKQGKNNHEKYCNSNPNRVDAPSHPISAEDRAKKALAMLKHIQNVKYNYNKNACNYIDELNKEKGWNLQHALNGGEKRFGPYSLDGYDEEKQIAFEYDEPEHRKPRKKEHDKLREQYLIENFPIKEFWRYDEYENKLYCSYKL